MDNHPNSTEQEIQELRKQVKELESELLAAQAVNSVTSSLLSLASNSPHPILRVTPEGTVVYQNATAARLQGWRSATNELLPLPLRLPVLQAATQNKPVEQDVLLDGRSYTVSVVPVPEERCVNVYGREITEYKKAEAALAESERRQREISRSLELDQARLAAVLRHLPVGVWIVDGQGRLIGSNPESDRIWGEGGPMPDTIQEYGKYVCWRPGAEEPLAIEEYPVVMALQTHELVPPQELKIRRFDLGEGTVLASAAPIKDNREHFMGVVAVNVDITVHKQSEWRLRRTQEIAHLGSWELDLANNCLTWSDEVYRIFGLEPQQFAATYEAFLEAVHPDDRAAVDAAYSGSIKTGKDMYEIEHRVIRRSTGEVRFVHEKCEHFRNQEGKIVRSVGMVHDITDWKFPTSNVAG